jgi:glycogen synthase
MKNGMAQDWSWERSAREYIELYKMLLKESKISRGNPRE